MAAAILDPVLDRIALGTVALDSMGLALATACTILPGILWVTAPHWTVLLLHSLSGIIGILRSFGLECLLPYP